MVKHKREGGKSEQGPDVSKKMPFNNESSTHETFVLSLRDPHIVLCLLLRVLRLALSPFSYERRNIEIFGFILLNRFEIKIGGQVL